LAVRRKQEQEAGELHTEDLPNAYLHEIVLWCSNQEGIDVRDHNWEISNIYTQVYLRSWWDNYW
jgi:hypothetical protein